MKPESRKEKQLRSELNEYGLCLETIRAKKNEPRLFLCAVRGLLIFMAVFGALAGLVSAFGLDFNFARVSTVLFLVSMLISLIYYNRFTFYSGYVLLLGGFAWFSSKYFLYVNSGYQAFLNTAAVAYDEYFHLPALRESTEIITDRYETVSMIMIFLGTVLAVLLNIFISAYMSLLMTFLVTFLPLQLAFYINREIPLPYLIMLLAVYMAVMVLKRSGNFALPSKYGKEHIFDRKEVKRKKLSIHKYLVSGSGMIVTAAAGLVIAAAFMLIMNEPLKKSADPDAVTNTVKTVTDEYVKTIAQGGIAALFDRYDSKGGLSRGRLGGIGSVSPDFKTDLLVRFVPYSSDPMYLRSYVGKSYGDNRFWPTFNPGDSENAVHMTLDSSGRQITEEGWADDDYIPIVAGSQNDEPVHIEPAGSIKDPSDTGYAQIIVIDQNQSEALKGSISSDHLSAFDITEAMLKELDRKGAEFGTDTSEQKRELLNLLIRSRQYFAERFGDDSQMGWDLFARLFVADIGADRSAEFAPYFSYYISKSARTGKKTFSDRWAVFANGSTVTGNIYSDGFASYYPGQLSQDPSESTEINGIDSFLPDEAAYKYEVYYLPYQSAPYYQPNPTITHEYEDYVYDRYLDVPDNMTETLRQVAQEAGIDSVAAEANAAREGCKDSYYSFYTRIMSDGNGLSQPEKERAFKALKIYFTDSANVRDFLLQNKIDPDSILYRAFLDLPYENLKAAHKKLVENEKYDASAKSYELAYSYVIGLIEEQRAKVPVTGYEYAASDIDREDYLGMQRLRLEILSKLKNFYRNEFTYTMSPGRTPRNRDVVEYFLTKRRRGFCAHFASSACLLLRSVGVPARYVEGYVISPEAVADGQVVSRDVSGFKNGDYGFNDSAVVDVEVTDAAAHAWIEVYIDGYGWIPYEMTPPSDEETLTGGLFGLLSGFFTGRQNPQPRENGNDNSNAGDAAGEGTSTSSGLFAGTGFILLPLAWLVLAMTAIWLITLASRRMIHAIRLSGLEKRGDYDAALILRYRYMLASMQKKGVIDCENPTVGEACAQMTEYLRSRAEIHGPGKDTVIRTDAAAMPGSSVVTDSTALPDNPIETNSTAIPGKSIGNYAAAVPDNMIGTVCRDNIRDLAAAVNLAAFSDEKTDEPLYRNAVGLIKDITERIKKAD